jgi:tmRNA-binding protein
MKVSFAMLLKTNVVKMSENRPLAMLMKKNELKSLSGDVDEKKGDGNYEL